MKLQSRPLGISLLIHIFALGLFFFWLVYDKPQKISPPLKIKISTFSPDAVAPACACQSQPPSTQPLQKPTPTPIKPSIIKKPYTPPLVVVPPIPAASVAAQAQPKTVLPKPAPETPLADAPRPAVVTAPPAPAVNVEKEFLDAHLGEIRALLLQNFKYPKMAQKLKMQGEVRVSFSLEKDGSVDNVKVIESSGFDLLDEDAMALINKTASRFPKPTKSVRISVPLSYVLR